MAFLKLAVLNLILPFLLCGCFGHYVHITYKVIDEEGRPIQGAKVTTNYWTGGGLAHLPERDYNAEGETDKDGIYSYRAFVKNEVNASAKKDGYYSSSGGSVGIFDIYEGCCTSEKVIPLRKKGTQVKMYAKSVNKRAPISVGTVGYDLIVGDFVKPYGAGEISDFVLHFTGKNHGFIGNVTFSNPGDGFNPSYYFGRSSRTFENFAPSGGYLPSLIETDELSHKMYCEHVKSKEGINSLTFTRYCENEKYRNLDPRSEFIRNINSGVKYYFKVRSQKDGSAMYGYGHRISYLPLGEGRRPYIEFTYYLNPDGSRNIEYGGSYFKWSNTEGNPPGIPE